MAHENSPSSIMYAELKDLGLSNRDVASVLLDTERTHGDSTIMDRIDSRTRLSRDIVHVAPGEISPSFFKDFSQSAQIIYGRCVARLRNNGARDARLEMTERFSGPAAESMQAALRDYHLDDNVYRNALARITRLELQNETDRSVLYLMLFLATGCIGDPAQGAQIVERFSSENIGSSFRTTEARVDLDSSPEESGGEDYLLGLARIVGGRLKGADSFYQLSPTEQGTEIGALSGANGAITDVDEDVSRRHARVFKKGTHWYIVGLKSTNGTTVISGADKLEHVVEPPKRDRQRGYEPEPFEIFPTDTICLGASTRFMVMPIMED